MGQGPAQVAMAPTLAGRRIPVTCRTTECPSGKRSPRLTRTDWFPAVGAFCAAPATVSDPCRSPDAVDLRYYRVLPLSNCRFGDGRDRPGGSGRVGSVARPISLRSPALCCCPVATVGCVCFRPVVVVVSRLGVASAYEISWPLVTHSGLLDVPLLVMTAVSLPIYLASIGDAVVSPCTSPPQVRSSQKQRVVLCDLERVCSRVVSRRMACDLLCNSPALAAQPSSELLLQHSRPLVSLRSIECSEVRTNPDSRTGPTTFFSSILALSSSCGRSSAPRSKETGRPDRHSPVAPLVYSGESNVLIKPTPGTTKQEKTPCSISPQ